MERFKYSVKVMGVEIRPRKNYTIKLQNGDVFTGVNFKNIGHDPMDIFLESDYLREIDLQEILDELMEIEKEE